MKIRTTKIDTNRRGKTLSYLLAAGLTFAVAGSGTATVNGGSLTLEDGATLKFNFTDRKTAPALNLAECNVTLGTEKGVR